MWLATHYSHFLQYDSITDAALMDSQTTTFHTCTVNLHVHVLYNTIQYNTIQYNTIQYNTVTMKYNTQYNATGFVQFFRNKFPGLFSLLSSIHFIFFWLSLTDFQNFPGPGAFFQDFPGLPGPVRTLYNTIRLLTSILCAMDGH